MKISKGAHLQYLSEHKIFWENVVAKLLIIVGVIPMSFFSLGILFALGGDEALSESLFLLIGLVLFFMIPLLIGLQKQRRNNRAREYEIIIRLDENGVITAQELMDHTRRSEEKIFKELEILFARGYFQECGLNKEKHCIITDSAKSSASKADS